MSAKTVVRGVVQHVPTMSDGYMDGIVRVQVLDQEGNVTEVVPVHLRAPHGVVADGDQVEIHGRKSEDGILRPRLVHNLTTGNTIRAPRWLLVGIVALFVVLLVASIAIFVASRDPQRPPAVVRPSATEPAPRPPVRQP